MQIFWVLALVLLATAPASVRAQQHGAPAPPREVGTFDEQARQLHAQFFVDPRIYAAEDGRRLVIGPFQAPGADAADVRVFDPASGRIMAVASTAMDTLSGADGERIILREHGRAIEWRRGDALVAQMRLRDDVRHESIRVRNGSVSLAGRVSSAGTGRRPAIVFVHGSGPGDRNDFYYGLLAAHFVDQGFAVLTYDKRSVGESTGGDWRNASMPELASDLAALLRYMRSRPDVDGGRVGVFGVSQASWVTPLAAMDVPVPFMALFSGVPVDTWESEVNETESELAGRNFNAAQREAARRAVRLMIEAAEAGGPTPALSAAVSAARNEPWFSATELSDTAEGIAAWRRVRYQPREVLERFTTPTFLAYGATDLITPYRQYAPIWRSYAETAGAADNLTIKVYSAANHGLLVSQAHDLNAANLPFAPGVISDLTAWLREHAGLAQASHTARDGIDQWRVLTGGDQYLGAFRLGDAVIAAAPAPAGFIRFDDFQNGLLTFLTPSAGSADAFVARAPDPTGLQVRFLDGNRGLLISRSGQPDQIAAPMGVRVEDVSIMSSDLRQHGLLIAPSTPGPHPVVMFFGGAGTSTRENFRTWGYLLAAHGMAALTFDKRGDGLSQGNAATARLGDLAQDGVAWFDFLSARADIDHARIGAIGLSRGGWTAPMVARARPHMAFMVVSSGGPISVRQSERYNRLLAVERAGHSRQAQGTAARVLDDYFDFLASNGTRKQHQISQHWARYASEPWFSLLRLPSNDPTTGAVDAWPPARTLFADDLRLDARSLYRGLDIPVLYVFGEADQMVPNEQTREIISELGRGKDWSVRVFPDAGHNFEVARGPGQLPRTAPGYYEALIDWLQHHTGERG